ncbi:MAG: SpoIIE family protein phosphatase [Planctomycetes bacterium]|nr:SpoIIE family protein phosphatase [Planctomycetota bacterium]MCH9728039.1 SpoIIE family protein phosphatase [Planctomycetota bacterium]MCH9775841.1 SpoIIE family protein phosphatase [Planctomycetota bacterium]MCH9791103.1 SpoIIE family protein phosphatase [Planctomycetota bacterium]MDF1745040.1 SpoIIE family protein phosphatase [Gimesia sp.]
MATLVMLQAGQAVSYSLSGEETVMGRHPDCQIQLDSNMVSRRHAHVVGDGDQYFVEDLGSGNGTFVNGKKIEGRTLLAHEDRLKVGPILFRFEADQEKQSKSSPVAAMKETGFDIGFSEEEEDDGSATIMGAVAGGGGFGGLDVRPESKLKAMIEISRSLAGTVDLEKLLPQILTSLFHIFPAADRGCILLKEESNGEMVPRAYKHRRAGEDATVKLSRTIVRKVLEEKSGILSADAASDAQFDASESISNLSIRSMMCVPMLGLSEEPIGVINIDTQNPVQQFQEEDLDLLMSVAGQAALSYESARLMTSYMAKQKQDNEMDIARGVQQGLLPSSVPEVDNYEFFASYDSAQAVGGDYYDIFELPEDKIGLSFGDVAGKGVPGAMIMSRMSSCVQNTMRFVHEVGPAVEAINDHMCDSAVEGRFVTYVLAILDTRKHHVSLVNAGHMSPMILKPDGSIDEFPEESIGMPIGVMEGFPYEVVERDLAPGEIVVLFTDGVDEAMNPAGELYTLDRMREFLKANREKNAAELGQALLADVRRHADGRPQNDDITIMTFGRVS